MFPVTVLIKGFSLKWKAVISTHWLQSGVLRTHLCVLANAERQTVACPAIFTCLRNANSDSHPYRESTFHPLSYLPMPQNIIFKRNLSELYAKPLLFRDIVYNIKI